ncbi:MAG TPA: MFS transporter, partial [Acidimicrobiia bacterium]|nr:MFS transporter [Acidimicrobiia bacterium]
ILIAAVVPTSREASSAPLDWKGLVLSSAGMGTLVLGIIQAPQWGWGSSKTFATLLAGVTVLAVFVIVEMQIERPMLDVGLFRNPRFTAASGSVTIGFFTLAGFTFLITQYFQFVKGYSPLGTGVRLLPVATSIAVASVLGTRFAVRIGNKAVVATGLTMFAATLFWIAINTASTNYLTLVGQMILGGSGLGLITAPATEAIMGVVPTEKAGIGSAVNDATRLFGAALGVAVIGSISASLYGSRLNATLPHGLTPQTAGAAKGSIGGALIAAQTLTQHGLTLPAHNLSVAAVAAFLHSMGGSLRVAGTVAIAGAIVAAALLPSRPTPPPVELPVDEPTAGDRVLVLELDR